ncbi:hypothetical protein GUJ93_ZPchr0012g19816 [Zizania palustris]|uniref:Uncharacterized protein n=1 Tax=Zizania palustris TaxID=103762 RepID=A0A8J5WPX3_ZIZPA|nr:hypothetical protein GUJ93_ZPchr0012g19816 [Zizania palustris]
MMISTLQRMRKPVKKLPRFMGLRAAMVTNCPLVSSFTVNLGFHVFCTEDFITQSGSSIAQSLSPLGFKEGNVQEASEFDMVFLHVALENTNNKLGKLGMKKDLNWLEKYLMEHQNMLYNQGCM